MSSHHTEYEKSDLNLKVVAVALVVTIVVLLLIVFLLKPVFSYRVADHQLIDEVGDKKLAEFQVVDKFPLPRLQNDVEGDMKAFRAHEEKFLSTYGWLDKEHGIVHIPVEEAIDRFVAQQGPGGAR